jgi:hypothetical protein
MAALEKGITKNGTGYGGKTWNILGQVYFPKAVTDSTFAFETNSEPGQFVPVHVHPTQDEFILVQEGTWFGCRAAFRTATSTSPTSRRARCSGCRRWRSSRRCSTSSTI